MNIANQHQNDSAVLARQDPSSTQFVTPLADVESTKDGYTIHAEMPGVDKSGLEITVNNGELTILGHRHTEDPASQPVYREIRQNELDPAIDTDGIAARIEQGVLTLTLPKAQSVKPRKITVD
jgi:HSP20 family protein